jgi:hypothetical protein
MFHVMPDDRSRGIALYVLCAGALSSARTKSRPDRGASNASAPTSGDHLAFLVGAVLVAATIVVAVIVLDRLTPASTADETPDAEPAISSPA